MPNSRFYSSTASVTTLQVTANPGDTSIQVASSVGWPNAFPFTLALDYGAANEELVDVTSGGPSVFTVTRAVDGTSSSTHNAGAVVRHVSSARDFTDSRSHEAATTNVHGITGSFVDTSSTQTLSNKTLNAPAINNGTITGTVTNSGTISGGTLSGPTLSGTVPGTPTFSGVPTFSAGAITEGLVNKKPAAGNIAESIQTDADTQARLNITAAGAMTWGPGGSTAPDTGPLQRTSAGVMGLTGALSMTGGLSVGAGISAADLALTGQTFQTYTPTYAGSVESITKTSNVGVFWKLGKLVWFHIYTVWGASGSGSTGIQVNLPSTPYRGSSPLVRQSSVTGWIDQTNTQPGSICLAPIFAGDSGTITGTVRDSGLNLYQAQHIQNQTTLTLEGWYREA